MPNPPGRQQPLHVARSRPRPRRFRLHNPPPPHSAHHNPILLRQPLPGRHASQQPHPPPLQNEQLHRRRRIPLPRRTLPPRPPPRRTNVRHRPRRHLPTNPARTLAPHLRRIRYLALQPPRNIPPSETNLPPRILRDLALDTHVRLRNASLAHGQDNFIDKPPP